MSIDRRAFLTASATLLAGSSVGCANTSADRSFDALRSNADALLSEGSPAISPASPLR